MEGSCTHNLRPLSSRWRKHPSSFLVLMPMLMGIHTIWPKSQDVKHLTTIVPSGTITLRCSERSLCVPFRGEDQRPSWLKILASPVRLWVPAAVSPPRACTAQCYTIASRHVRFKPTPSSSQGTVTRLLLNTKRGSEAQASYHLPTHHPTGAEVLKGRVRGFDDGGAA